MIYLVYDARYMRMYGIVRALRFSRKFDDFTEALIYLSSKDNWYDLRIITVEKEKYDNHSMVRINNE